MVTQTKGLHFFLFLEDVLSLPKFCRAGQGRWEEKSDFEENLVLTSYLTY